MKTWIYGVDDGEPCYWGLPESEWVKWVAACDEQGHRLELDGINEWGEFLYQRYQEAK